MAHDAAQRPAVDVAQAVEHALGGAVEGVVMLARRLQEAAAQHRRQAERDEAGNQDRHHDHHRELVEQAADDAAHEQHRNEHGGQRQRHGKNGEADFACRLRAPPQSATCPFPCAGRCFPAPRWRRPPRSPPPASAPSATDCRACSPAATCAAKVPTIDSGSARLGMMVAETLRRNRKITSTTSTIASISVNFTSLTDSRMDSRTVVEHVQVDGRRQLRAELRQQRLDAVHHFHGVGAGLAHHLQSMMERRVVEPADASCRSRRCRSRGPGLPAAPASRCGRRRSAGRYWSAPSSSWPLACTVKA